MVFTGEVCSDGRYFYEMSDSFFYMLIIIGFVGIIAGLAEKVNIYDIFLVNSVFPLHTTPNEAL